MSVEEGGTFIRKLMDSNKQVKARILRAMRRSVASTVPLRALSRMSKKGFIRLPWTEKRIGSLSKPVPARVIADERRILMEVFGETRY